MNEIEEYMVNGHWKTVMNEERKRELWKMAKESQSSNDIKTKIGGLLIYNQVIDECLKDIVDYCVWYMKASIWPVAISLTPDFSKKTFGQVIELFCRCSTVEYNREIIIGDLRKFNKARNTIVHNLFSIKNLQDLEKDIDDYLLLGEEIFDLLLEYDNCICERFIELLPKFQNVGDAAMT